MFRSTRLAIPILAASVLQAAVPTAPTWIVARTANFEVFSDAGPQTARSTLLWFEQLQRFFIRQTGLAMNGSAPVRVIVFRSAREYDEFRPRAGAAAFYAGMGTSNYIVMESSHGEQAGIAAHEYAHCLMHANHLALPRWLSEGVAEVFSSVRITDRASTIGGDLPGRRQILQRGEGLPIAALMAASDDVAGDRRFYAESWALAHMLLFSPA